MQRRGREGEAVDRCWWWMESGGFRRHRLIGLGDHVGCIALRCITLRQVMMIVQYIYLTVFLSLHLCHIFFLSMYGRPVVNLCYSMRIQCINTRIPGFVSLVTESAFAGQMAVHVGTSQGK